MIVRLDKLLFHGRHEAMLWARRVLPEPVRRGIKRLFRLRKTVVAQTCSSGQTQTAELLDEYHRLMAANIAGVLLKIMARFYRHLGVDPRSIPLVKALESFRAELPVDKLVTGQAQAEPVLVQFERAFALSEAGQVDDALSLFEAVFRNSAAREVVPNDPYVKEAVVLSGEILGRFHEKRGNVDAAIAIYREILSFDKDGLIARRLTLILSRRGDLREAAEFAEIASHYRLNLFPRIPETNPYIAALKTQFLGKNALPPGFRIASAEVSLSQNGENARQD